VSNLDIFINWGKNDKYGFLLPVNPESYSVENAQQNTSVTIHDFGELNLKGKRALKKVSWSCFFPHEKYDFSRTKFEDPITFYVFKLTNLLEKNTTVHVMIGEKLNLYGTIESFTWGEDEGTGDVNYSISIKEDRVAQETAEAEADGAMNAAGDVPGGAAKISYKWKKGDTWKNVCKAKLGDNSAKVWKKNQKDNKKVITKAKKAYKKKHKKAGKEAVALIGYKVVLSK
jgi:hypothetical protein